MNWLDFSLVALSVVDVWIIGPIGINADLRMMSMLRMLRLIRLARLFRLFRMFKELTLLVNGFVDSVKTLFWALIFLSIMVYIFSIFARQTANQVDECQHAIFELGRPPMLRTCHTQMQYTSATVPSARLRGMT